MSVSEEATVTSKGQVTIPKRIRDALDIDAGTEVEFVLEDDGTISVRPKRPPMDRLREIKERLEGRDVDIDRMRRESKDAWESAYDGNEE
jgi:AbrB family looped-hinge helix DNA binding protein